MDIDLQNKNILVTREEGQAEDFAEKIQQCGGNAYITPLLKVNSVVSTNHLQIFENLQHYEWIFFTSANGVHCFFDIWKCNFESGNLKDHKIAVVGPKTNDVLREYGYQAAFIPSIYNAKTMAAEFLSKYDTKHPVLFIRGQLSSNILPDAFTKAGLDYECLIVYETCVNNESRAMLNERLGRGDIDYITLTSPSTVDAFFSLIENVSQIEGKEIVCIGTTTENRAIEKGLSKLLVPKDFTIEGMIAGISDHLVKKG
jgi:uroporphyrinogen-III synthase